jgi:hypothetical protein
MSLKNNYAAWAIDPAAFPYQGSLKEKVTFICQYGLLAPSVHNTQPWRFMIAHDSMQLILDADRSLTHGDPTGRQTWISLGACAENITLAAQDYGLSAIIHKPEQAEDKAVVLKFTADQPPSGQQWLEPIMRRVTNRTVFKEQKIDTEALQAIANCWQSDDVLVKVVTDPKAKQLIADLTARGIGMALTIPEFRAELAAQIRPNHTKAHDGMPGSTLNPGSATSFLMPLRYRHRSAAPADAAQERRKQKSAAAFVLIFTKGDISPYWFQAGRAYERTLLMATRYNIAAATSAAAVEAPDFHQEIEQLCGTDYRLQTVTRLGYSDQQPPHSPRRTIEQVLTSA